MKELTAYLLQFHSKKKKLNVIYAAPTGTDRDKLFAQLATCHAVLKETTNPTEMSMEEVSGLVQKVILTDYDFKQLTGIKTNLTNYKGIINPAYTYQFKF